MAKLSYPCTPTIDHVDNYHGTPVSDPYRWLEDIDSPQTREWIAAQNQLTFSFLATIPERSEIRERLTALWNYPKAWAPFKYGQRYFQLRNNGLQNQNVLYVLDKPDGNPRLLLDPNELSPDGTVAMTSWQVSEDGRLFAYATSASGSDWLTWRVRDVESGVDLPDRLEWSKFSGVAWLPDGSGFFYCRYDPPADGQVYTGANYFQKLYLHRLGEPQSQDRLVYHRPDQKEWGFYPMISEDGRYLVLQVTHGTDTRNRLFYQDLPAGGEIVELIDELDANYGFVGNDGPVFYLRTDLDAPRGRLIAVDTNDPARDRWRTIIPESRDVLVGTWMVNDQFVALYMHDAYHQLKRFDREGHFLGDIPLPTLGSIVELGNLDLNGRRQDDELFFSFHSYVYPVTVLRYDFKTDKVETLFAPPIHFDFSQYETRQIFAISRDGTRVPMFLTQRRERGPGPHPTLLYGYGGFDLPQPPVFSISWLTWLERGGVLAVASLRGGGEYGAEWHHAGMLEHKQNVFDDMISCAEHLITTGMTTRDKLAIQGRSNGGLLVGACLTQRPDLFRVALPAVGVMDMLRFQKFTIGWAWVSDYGSSDNPEQFKVLYAYSPLHNVKPGTCYPATLITTADHDDRVAPLHSFKFAATLQAAQACDAPVLIRIDQKAGHGFGKPTALLIEEQADIWSFLIHALQ